jgi:quercetin dioxygenase-like cupin family protein
LAPRPRIASLSFEDILVRIHADFHLPACVAVEEQAWIPSPQAGVERVMLDRIGEEKARATSLVRYAPRSEFAPHAHPGGEEILVLDGVFSADGEDFPAGTYLRNPPGSAHRPYSAEGARIFVKLWQMHPAQSAEVRVDTRDPQRWQALAQGAVCPLYDDAFESVRLLRLAPGQRVLDGAVEGAEMLVLEGELQWQGRALAAGSWLRLPAGEHAAPITAAGGACLYLKLGALGGPQPPSATGASDA